MRNLFLYSVLSLLPVIAAQALPLNDPSVVEFIAEMTREHPKAYSQQELQVLFGKVKRTKKVLQQIAKPAEGKSWAQYKKIFLTKRRIDAGRAFMQKQRSSLLRAEASYQIPAEIIAAIIGVETFYGQRAGRRRVIDALSTLAFYYAKNPRRAQFFRRELKAYLLLTREQRMDPLQPVGSYAGAMGIPQFISSSYQKFAIDFDGDGKRDIWHNYADAIGSVAYYLSQHGWQGESMIVLPAKITRKSPPVVSSGLALNDKARNLDAQGVTTKPALPAHTPIRLFMLEGDEGKEYWVALNNFYVISRYNHSFLYSMAVYQLAEQLKEAR